METNNTEAKCNKVAKPSKTGTLTSLKGVAINLEKLGWGEKQKEFESLIKWLKEKIVNEL